jgi:uncharacterized protein
MTHSTPKSLFTTLPVEKLQKSIQFYSALGMSHNLDWSDENTACMQLEENIFFMLTTKPKFQSYIANKAMTNTQSTCSAIHTLQFDSREVVDQMVELAKNNGGRAEQFSNDPSYDSWMYNFRVEDPDGNNLEFMYMDLEAMAKAFS